MRPGDTVRPRAPTRGRLELGVLVEPDSGHYHATVNGRAVWVVRWRGGGLGGGWREDDLVRVREARGDDQTDNQKET